MGSEDEGRASLMSDRMEGCGSRGAVRKRASDQPLLPSKRASGPVELGGAVQFKFSTTSRLPCLHLDESADLSANSRTLRGNLVE